MERELITIVTIVFNDVESLEQTVLSVIHQTYPNIEYIVIDGGSTDGSLEILKKYNNYISKLIIEKDKGIYDAMNKAVEKSDGEWINFLNAGDTYVDNNVIDEMFKEEIDIDIDVMFGDINYVFDNRKLRRDSSPKSTLEVPKYICHQETFVRSIYLKKNLFDLSFKICADFKVIYDYFSNGGVFKHKQISVANYKLFGYSFYNFRVFQEELYRITNNKSYLSDTKSLLISIMIKYFPEFIKYIYYKKLIKHPTITIIHR